MKITLFTACSATSTFPVMCVFEHEILVSCVHRICCWSVVTGHQHTSEWMNCTLCRTRTQSNVVLKKASERKVEWPRPKPV